MLLSVVGLLMLSACGGEKKKQAEADDAKLQKEMEAMESIVDHIEKLYETIAKHPERSLKRFACHTWWDAVEAVEERDAELEEIGFFNDDLWTQMQDTNPDEFEVRDVLFEELDVEEGTALVDFVLWSPIQTVHQKFRLCQEEGEWLVHDIIRINEYDDGGNNLQSLRFIALFKEIGHGLRVQMSRHDTRATAQNLPCKERADKGISETDPGRGKTEVPTELSGITDEDNGREVGSTEGEGRQPRADVASAEHETVYVGGMLSAAEADEDHQCEEAYQHDGSQSN